MTQDPQSILPSTKVAALLDDYPELEEVLIALAPPFKKLRNPLLRRSIAKVASLQQASAVARLPVLEVVNKLRAAVGQALLESCEEGADQAYLVAEPDWFAACTVVHSMDQRVISLDDDEMAVNEVVRRAKQLKPGEMIELITTFLPAPGIDLMRAKGYRVWPRDGEAGLVHTYFAHA